MLQNGIKLVNFLKNNTLAVVTQLPVPVRGVTFSYSSRYLTNLVSAPFWSTAVKIRFAEKSVQVGSLFAYSPALYKRKVNFKTCFFEFIQDNNNNNWRE